MLCNDDDIAAEIEKITGGKGAYGAIDCVAGELTGRMLAAVRPTGTLLVYGAMAGFTTQMNVGDLLFKQKVRSSHTSCRINTDRWFIMHKLMMGLPNRQQLLSA